MTIYDKNGQEILTEEVDDNSYRYRAIKQGEKVYLYFSLTEHIEIPIGSYIDYQGQRYTLWRPENLTKHGERNIEYSIEFGGYWELLRRFKYKFLSIKPYKLKFHLTGTLYDFLQLLVDCMNLYDTGWSVGSYIETTEKTLSFNHEYCLDVLNRLADEFDTEWNIVDKTISLCKVEYFKDAPLPLSYGKGNGFKTGVARQNQGENTPVTILYVQGGEKNIDVSKYKNTTLLLPKSQELEYEGRKYCTDKDGMFITRADQALTVYSEDSYDGSNIYPSRVGTISEVIEVDAEKNLYDFKDSSIPDSLNFADCRIAGEKATVIFQSGILTGKEFDLEQTENQLTGYIHSERRFKIVPQEMDGTVMPGDSFIPKVGDKYAIFNISLPEAYVCDNATKTGASWDMFREAVRYMYEKEDNPFSFTGELDGIYSSRNWLEIGGKILPGGYVLFSDTQFQPKGILIRIIAVTDYINKPHSPKLELSNVPVAGLVSSELGKLEADKVTVDNQHKNAIEYTKRRYRDALETQSMLEKVFDNFSKGINPVWVQTMSLLVGEESLQFRFVNSKTNPVVIEPNFIYSQSTKVFTAPKSILQHMTLGIMDIKGEHKASEYKYWDLPAYTSPALSDFGAMYLYAKCSKHGSSGSFYLTESAYKMDPGDGFYYFLIGTLGSESDGARSFATVYGFTEILPGRITVDRIISTDGTTYFNLGVGEIGGVIRFASGTTGYENIKDKPDLSIYGTTAMLNAVKNDLQNQIDGKIETYYQSSNPWNSWPSGEEPTHVGDLWYNTSSKILQRYVGPSSNIWERIYDADAIAAAEAASTAQDTADGKRRVFLRTPYPPYDAGDQWIQYNGSGSMRICVQGRQSGNYVSSDWQLSSADGNTQASIDRGVISAAGFMTFGGSAGMAGSGDIRIWSGGTNANNATFQVSASGEVMAKKALKLQNQQAGITGEGTADTSVRFWAGSSTPANAPFRIYQNGNGLIGGLRLESGGLFSVDNKYGFDSSAKFFLHSQGSNGFLGFSSTGKWAGIGLNTLPATTGVAALLRLENTVSGGTTKYGAVISVSGASHNVALMATGHVRVKGSVIADTIVAAKIRAASNINGDGSSYQYLDGVTFGYNDYDLDKVRFQVQNGIIVGVKKE